jgi:hypothetical protein
MQSVSGDSNNKSDKTCHSQNYRYPHVHSHYFKWAVFTSTEDNVFYNIPKQQSSNGADSLMQNLPQAAPAFNDQEDIDSQNILTKTAEIHGYPCTKVNEFLGYKVG